jgi:hypothetical protein
VKSCPARSAAKFRRSASARTCRKVARSA